MMRVKLRVIAIAAACAGLYGCSPLAPRPDLSKFFLLTPIASGAEASPPRGTLVIGVGPIDFPDYLRRPDVVTRTSPTEIDVSSTDIWGEPLDKNFSRVLRENLAQLLNTQKVEEYPWSRNTKIDYQIEVDVQRFEKAADGQSQLVARWIIKDGRSGTDLYAYETRATTPVAASDTVASVALSNNLATLSQDIASQISNLSRQRAS
jgi:uncharacterized lipoprotein YmbA